MSESKRTTQELIAELDGEPGIIAQGKFNPRSVRPYHASKDYQGAIRDARIFLGRHSRT